jgi:hypothetical protein
MPPAGSRWQGNERNDAPRLFFDNYQLLGQNQVLIRLVAGERVGKLTGKIAKLNFLRYRRPNGYGEVDMVDLLLLVLSGKIVNRLPLSRVQIQIVRRRRGNVVRAPDGLRRSGVGSRTLRRRCLLSGRTSAGDLIRTAPRYGGLRRLISDPPRPESDREPNNESGDHAAMTRPVPRRSSPLDRVFGSFGMLCAACNSLPSWNELEPACL